MRMETKTRTFHVPQATGDCVEAPVLVSRHPFSARYDLDRTTGLVTREGHPLQGQSLSGRIFVAPGVQGGVAAGWAIPAMAARKVCFAGLLLGVTNPVMVQGAVRAGVPIGAGWDIDMLEALNTGDIIRFDPGRHLVTLIAPA